MKTLSIFVDMRKSKLLSLKEKKVKYRLLYNQFHNYEHKGTINHRLYKEVGDGIILVYDANKLSNKKELISLLSEIQSKVLDLIKNTNEKFGIGISYSLSGAFNTEYQFLPSIDGASVGANLANKYLVNKKYYLWVLPLKTADDGDGSINELVDIIEGDERFDYRKSASGKNLWFEIL